MQPPVSDSWFRLDGRVALVTGGSQGIGLAIAEGLARQGAGVVISSRKGDVCEERAAALRGRGLNVRGMACHAGRLDDIRGVLEATADQFGRLDILVNNAATNPFYGPVQDADPGVFDKIMEVNVRGPFLLCREAYPMLKESGRASVINIASVEAFRPDKGLGLYSVSKAALVSLTQVLAKEWGPDGIRVNALCPGIVKTRFSAALWQNETIMNHIRSSLPLGRVATPEEMAGFAIFLASDAASYCTGGAYLADGGFVIA